MASHHGLDRTAPPGDASVLVIITAHVSENPQTRRLHIHVVAVLRDRRERENTAHVSRILKSSHLALDVYRVHDAPACVFSTGSRRKIDRHRSAPFSVRLVRYLFTTHRRTNATTTRDDGRTLAPGDVETDFSRTSTRGRLVTGWFHARTLEAVRFVVVARHFSRAARHPVRGRRVRGEHTASGDVLGGSSTCDFFDESLAPERVLHERLDVLVHDGLVRGLDAAQDASLRVRALGRRRAG